MTTTDIETTWPERAAGMDTVDELTEVWVDGAAELGLADQEPQAHACEVMPTRLCPAALRTTCGDADLPCARFKMDPAQAEALWSEPLQP